MLFTRYESSACSHKVHTWGAVVPWHSPKFTNLCSSHPHRSHTNATMMVQVCAPSNSTARREHPCCALPKFREFLNQNLLYGSGDFNTFGPFLERVVIFQMEPFMMHKTIALMVNSTVQKNFMELNLNTAEFFSDAYRLLHTIQYSLREKWLRIEIIKDCRLFNKLLFKLINRQLSTTSTTTMKDVVDSCLFEHDSRTAIYWQ